MKHLNQFFPCKLFVNENRTYVNKLKFSIFLRFCCQYPIINYLDVKCDECGQEICNSFILKRHKATVHGTRPTNVHQCDYCPLFYNRKSALDKHMVKHHPINQI